MTDEEAASPATRDDIAELTRAISDLIRVTEETGASIVKAIGDGFDEIGGVLTEIREARMIAAEESARINAAESAASQ